MCSGEIGKQMLTPPELGSGVPLVGRSDELSQIALALEAGGFCTLVGPGGAGKTRLALETVARSDRRFHFVGLARAGPGDVAGSVARALSIETPPGLETMDALEEALRAEPRAIVLDNCEHRIDEVRELVARIAAVPGVAILATSRRRIGFPGERVVAIGPLPAADANAFVLACLQSRRPHLVPDEADRERIASIARSLDGLPVAIELATSRFPAISIAQLARALRSIVPSQLHADDVPDDRHRTLQRVVEWSVSLLDPNARRAFEACSVFEGPFDAEDISAIVAEPRTPFEASAPLETLVEHSLVVKTAVGRYWLLAPVRAVARRLAPAATHAADAARHARRMRDVAEATRAAYVSTDLTKMVAAIAARYGDYIAALDWSFRHKPLMESGIDLAHALTAYWVEGGHVVDGAEWLLRAMAAAETARLDPGRLASLGYMYARVCHAAGDFAKIVERGPSLVGAFTQAGDRLGLARAYNLMSVAALCTGAVDDAEAFGGTALAIYSAIEQTTGVAAALCNLGNAALDGRDDPEGAIEQYERALEVSMRPGGEGMRVLVLGNLAEAHYTAGRLDRSESYARSSLEAAARLGNDANQAWGNSILARIALKRGLPDEASVHLAAALRHLSAGPNAEFLATAVEIAGRLAWERGSADEAARLLLAASRFRIRHRLLRLGTTVDEAKRLLERVVAALGIQEAGRAERESRSLTSPTALLAAARTSLEVGARVPGPWYDNGRSTAPSHPEQQEHKRGRT